MTALPLLEKVRVLCSDIERRRLAVANVLSDSAKTKQNIATDNANKHHNGKNNNNTTTRDHENVDFIRDHFTLRQSDAVREASDSILDSLDGEELARLAQLFLSSRLSVAKATNNNNNNNNKQDNTDEAAREILDSAPNPQLVATKSIESFEQNAMRLREYHRQYPQKSYQLPQLERPNDQDIHRIRRTLFTGPERKGKAVDLNAAYKLFRDFQTKSSLASAQAGVVMIDHEVTYTDFVADPIRSAATAGIKRKLGSSACQVYIESLSSAAVSLERFVGKTRPLTAAGEIKETRDRVTNTIATISNNRESFFAPNRNFISEPHSSFSEKVKEAWKKFSYDTHIIAAGSSDKNQQQQQQQLENVLLKILQLEEHISLLCTSVIGEGILQSSADHITRCALRSTAEEIQDDEDDELRFQESFFDAFYAQPPISDRIGLTLSDNGRDLASNLVELEKLQIDAASSNNNTNNNHDGDDGDDHLRLGEDGDEDNNGLSAEDRAKLTNPKNFPLDALGNPIPVWLYKLHQLDKKFHCEICNQAYPGEKIFVQHFGEARHERGLAAIGIEVTPLNARHFELVATRQGALEAKRRLLLGEENAKRRQRGDDVEEEDATGNVVVNGGY